MCADGADTARDLVELDHVLFEHASPFVGISPTNTGCAITRDLAAAQQWLREPALDTEVVTVAGTLRASVLAADVDPADTGADSEAGEAAAEELIDRAEALGLPWLLRASGRVGGRHVLVAGPLDRDVWAQWCHCAAAQHDVGVQPRRTLRLLAAPHRLGLSAPVLAGTLTPGDLPEPTPSKRTARRRRTMSVPRRSQRTSPSTAPAEDRSRREYGDALARARAGWSAHRAFAAAAAFAGSKACEQGELAWRRWVWSPAVTVVAAERGASEDEAWAMFEQASRRRAKQLGREGWRRAYWGPALEEAAQERPRRRRLDEDAAGQGGQVEQSEIERVRAGLHAAADEVLTMSPRRPQFRRSLAAALDALAPMLVRRAGSLAERAWCETARLARSTLRAVLSWLVEHDILRRDHHYSGGTADCTSWLMGARSHAALAAETTPPQTRSTGGTPPPQPPTVGRADPDRLRATHKRERQAREEEISDLTDTSVPAESDPVTHRAARSLAYQRRWWTSLDSEEQTSRRESRRKLLGTMHRSRRSAWFSWLSRRRDLAAAAERVLNGQPAPDDQHSLAAAPMSVHRGLHAQEWTVSADVVLTPTELPLVAQRLLSSGS